MTPNLIAETVAIELLKLDPANVRKHAKKNLSAIKGSLIKFGQQKPIVVNSRNVVIAGNGTLMAAKELGWQEISVVRSDLKGTDAIAFALADNRTAELAEWDDELLAQTLDDLSLEFDLSAIGFDEFDFKAKEESEETFEPPKEWLIVISCGNENEQAELYDKLSREGVQCKIM